MQISRTWEATYKHDRRKHRHRCFCCQRILSEGEPVLMGRVGGKTTRALHIECSEVRTPENWTYRKLLEAHTH